MVPKSARILVVGGGGTMGSSTALHLARRGYTDIRVLDVYESPSANSAGNDLNKIAGTDSTGVWGELSIEAWDMWTSDPVFKPHGHAVGKLDLTSNDAREKELRAKYERIIAEGRGDTVEWLKDEEAILSKAPHLKGADIKGWRGLYCSSGGWVAARDALASVARSLRSYGVKTAFGTSGTFSSLLLSPDGSCAGVRCVDGTEWSADLVVFAAGAWSPGLIDLEGQCESKCWVYAHVQLSPDEAERMRAAPTVYNDKLGFFMEPHPTTNILKLCNEFPGFTHLTPARPFGSDPGSASSPLISVPRSHADHPTDTIPASSLSDIRALIRTCLPHLRDRPLINQAMCWCTDMPDARWLLCEHPRWRNLVLATGDSGHTFKMLPVVGREVVDLIEGKLPEARRELWKWRPGRGDPEHTGRGGPPPKDIADLPGWRHDDEEPSSTETEVVSGVGPTETA